MTWNPMAQRPDPAPALAEFLLERFAEDEAIARAVEAKDPPEKIARTAVVDLLNGVEMLSASVVAYPTARVLAECEAKRRIVEQFQRFDAQGREDLSGVTTCHATGLLGAMKFLATVYADHPDYRGEWRP